MLRELANYLELVESGQPRDTHGEANSGWAGSFMPALHFQEKCPVQKLAAGGAQTEFIPVDSTAKIIKHLRSHYLTGQLITILQQNVVAVWEDPSAGRMNRAQSCREG